MRQENEWLTGHSSHFESLERLKRGGEQGEPVEPMPRCLPSVSRTVLGCCANCSESIQGSCSAACEGHHQLFGQSLCASRKTDLNIKFMLNLIDRIGSNVGKRRRERYRAIIKRSSKCLSCDQDTNRANQLNPFHEAFWKLGRKNVMRSNQFWLVLGVNRTHLEGPPRSAHPRKSRHIEAGRVERVYHGTSEDAVPRPMAKPRCLFEAKKIMKQGFKASTDGLLGAGVYVTTDRSSWDASRTGHSVPR